MPASSSETRPLAPPAASIAPSGLYATCTYDPGSSTRAGPAATDLRGDVDEEHLAVCVTDGDGLPVRAEVDRDDGRALRQRHRVAGLGEGRRIPEREAIAGSDRDCRSVRAERPSEDDQRSLRGEHERASEPAVAGHIPDDDGAVLARRVDRCSVRGDRRCEHPARVPAQDLADLAGLDVPDDDLRVVAAREERRAVRAEAGAEDLRLVADAEAVGCRPSSRSRGVTAPPRSPIAAVFAVGAQREGAADRIAAELLSGRGIPQRGAGGSQVETARLPSGVNASVIGAA